MEDLSHAVQAVENLEQRHQERMGTSYPKTCDLLFRSPCVPQKRVDSTTALFPDYAQMRAHIVTVINSRTRGLAPMMMGNFNKEASDNDELVEG